MKSNFLKLTPILFSIVLFSSLIAPTSPVAIAASTTDGVSISNETDQKIQDSKLAEILDTSRKIASEYKKNNLRSLNVSETKQVIDYYRIENETGYFYETTPDNKESLVIIDLNDTPLDKNIAESTSVAAAISSIPSGIGGRAVISKNGSYLNATVTTATASQMGSTKSGIGWIYSGFNGTGKRSNGTNYSMGTDMGLQYSNAYGYVKWTPYVLLNDGGKEIFGDPLRGYDKLQYKNGFVGGTDVNFTVYKNVNNNTRLSLIGFGVCADMECNNTEDTYLTSIIEVAGTNINTVSTWKVLATVAGSENVTGKNYARFSNINLDGNAVTPVVDAQDYATVSVSGNNATINVSR
ncbi:YrpD family protein [Paenibacillus sp. PK4536]|uniref:YrpD family protein n=1 Tax=Paenibacillus sp. PK4536 TaxID=3024576 RepID=UPI0023597DFF|nr:YrpD family protein [Paenibacillus sp. PK4536]WIM40149.1 YrpD family protein [Paenibacillus sp. PK4536]